MIIEKTALKQQNEKNHIFYYDSARTAWKKLLLYLSRQREYKVLLPGYIGVSPKEGSGIYDPVAESGIRYGFYRMDGRLCIDTGDLEQKLNGCQKAAVLLVHYFGYPDKNIRKIVEICRSGNAIVVEDCAHAFYTDFIDHSCGGYGDYAIYSIHKMLPYNNGGFLKIRHLPDEQEYAFFSRDTMPSFSSVFEYDFYRIARARKRNAQLWENLLAGMEKQIEMLHIKENSTGMDITPQTFPVLVKQYDRTKLYFELNQAGFGAVSLYHTLIDPLINNRRFEDAAWTSKHILNLPVHQDIVEGQIEQMCSMLLKNVCGN